MLSFSRTGAIVLRQLYLLRGSPVRILPIFTWVMIDIVLWGFMTRYLHSVTEPKLNFVAALLGAVLMWDFFVRVMHGMATAFLEDVWSRNFLNWFASPLTIFDYLAGLVVTSTLTSLVALVLMVVLAAVAFGLSMASYGLALIPFLMVLFLFGIALGIFSAGLVLGLGPASEWFIWPIPAVLSPFVGVFYPLATLPHWMQWISYTLPPAYVFEGMRTIVAGGVAETNGMLIGLALSVVEIALACWFFQHVFTRAVRTGLLARYAAEGSG